MSADPNSFENIKGKLSKKTLRDIEGLDPAVYGFTREECCGGIPAKMRGSMRLKEHIFLGTSMHFTEWSKRTENVPGHDALLEGVRKASPEATFTVCQLDTDTDSCVLRFLYDEERESVKVTQYNTTNNTGSVPWEQSRGTYVIDRSDEYFLFVCSHRTRDERCGYCGAVLVDLLRQSIARKLSEREGAPRVTVLPCSHVGGHIYAGNVIMYSRHGGVCFGLFTPSDVDILVNHIASEEATIPPALVEKIRGQMGYVGPSRRRCSTM